VKRSGAIVWMVVVVGLATLSPAAADTNSCDAASCGKPECWTGRPMRVRPGLTREIRVSCWRITGATLVTPPPHVDVSDVTADEYGIRFKARPHDGSPRYDTAVFEVTGYTGQAEVQVTIETVPTSENSPPVCDGDHVTQRSDGTGPVEISMWIQCSDPDGDEFTVDGGGPGEHRDAPKLMPANTYTSEWRYRTATSSGDEATRIWATDVLGARSDDALLVLTVGPAVDRPPECGSTPIASRPGEIRRFGLICQDADADPFEPRLSSPPLRGSMPIFAVDEPMVRSWGAQRRIDATYVPADSSLELDPFSVTASGAAGDGPVARLAIVPRPLPENGGGNCGYGPAYVRAAQPVRMIVTCADDEGDALSAEVLVEPRHGTVAPAVVAPAKFGYSDITIPYVPNPGYVGYDCVKVKVSDGHGLVFVIIIDIWVLPTYAPIPIAGPMPPLPPELPPLPPGLPPLPPGLPPLPPGLPPLPPLAPRSEEGTQAAMVRALAERGLGTTAVKRLRAAGGAEVWARSELSRRDLLTHDQASGLVVVCLAGCEIRADTRLATGLPASRASRNESVAAKTPGESQVLLLTLSRAERSALSRMRKPRATFRVRVRAASGKPLSVRRSMRIAG
jgi:hypothetical protein